MISKKLRLYVIYGNNVTSAQLLEASPLGVGERSSVSKGVRGQCSNDEGKQQMSPPLPPAPSSP